MTINSRLFGHWEVVYTIHVPCFLFALSEGQTCCCIKKKKHKKIGSIHLQQPW